MANELFNQNYSDNNIENNASFKEVNFDNNVEQQGPRDPPGKKKKTNTLNYSIDYDKLALVTKESLTSSGLENYRKNAKPGIVKAQRNFQVKQNLLNKERQKQQELQKYAPGDDAMLNNLIAKKGEDFYLDRQKLQEQYKNLYSKTFKGKLIDNYNKQEKIGKWESELLPMRSSLKGTESVAKFLWNDIVNPVASGVLGVIETSYDKITDNNTITDKESVKLKQLEKTLNQSSASTIKNMYDNFSKFEKLNEKRRKEVGMTTALLNRVLSETSTNYNNAVNNTGGLGGFVTELGNIQIIGNIERIIFMKKVSGKKPNELTDTEKALIQAYQELDKSRSPSMFTENYKFGQNFTNTVEFIGEMVIGDGIGKVIGSAVKKGGTTLLRKATNDFIAESVKASLRQGIKNSPKLSKFLNTTVAPTFMPSTYGNALKNSSSYQIINSIDNERNNQGLMVMNTNAEKQMYSKKLTSAIDATQVEIQRLQNIKNPNQDVINQLNNKKEQLQLFIDTKNELVDDNGNLINPEKSYGRELFKAWTENLKENFTEKIVGHKFDKVSGKMLSKLGATKLGQKADEFLITPKEKMAQFNDFLYGNKMSRITSQLVKKVGPFKVINSLPAEMFEEAAINLIPTIDGNYGEQLAELVDPHFYKEVAMQTLLLGGASHGLSTASHFGKLAINKGYRKQVNDRNDFVYNTRKNYYDITKNITDDKLPGYLTSASLGTFANHQETQNEINRLRNKEGNNSEGLTQEERDKRANHLEKNSFINMAINAINSGTVDGFKYRLNQVIDSENTSETTKNNAKRALEKLDKYSKLTNQYKDVVGGNLLTAKAIELDLNEETLTDFRNKRTTIVNDLQQELDKYNETLSSEDSIDIDDIDTEISRYREAVNKELTSNEESNKKYEETGKAPDVEYESNKNVVRFLNQFQESDNVFTNYLNNSDGIQLGENHKKYIEGEMSTLKQMQTKEGLAKLLKDLKNQEKINNVDASNITDVKNEINDDELVPEDNAKIDEKVNQQGQKTQELKNGSVVQNNIIDNDDRISLNDLFDEDDEGLPESFIQQVKQEQENNNIETLQEQNMKVDSLFAPVELDETNPRHQQKLNQFETIFRNMQNKNEAVTFGGLIAGLVSNFPPYKIERDYNIIAQAWINTNSDLSENEIEKTYIGVFGNKNDFESIYGDKVPNTVQDSTEDDEKVETTETKLGVNSETGQVEVQMRGFKITNVGVKAAFLSLNYELSEDGLEYITVSNTINPNSYPYLNTDNFKTGDKVKLKFNWNYFDIDGSNSMKLWNNIDSDNPSYTNVTIKDIIENIYGPGSYSEVLAKTLTEEGRKELLSNEEFLKIVPTNFQLGNRDIDSGINDYDWWNAKNVALPLDETTKEPLPFQRAKLISQNRKLNLETRKVMIEKGEVELTVAQRREGFQNRILDNNKFNSLEDAFQGDTEAVKQNIGFAVVATNNSLQSEKNGKSGIINFNNKEIYKRDIVNFEEWSSLMKGNTAGKIVIIKEAGVNENGKKIYTINSPINNHISQTERFAFYNSLYDIVQNYSKRYQSEKANGKLSEEILAIEKSLNSRNISLSNNTFRDYFKDFYPERRTKVIKTQEEAEQFNSLIGSRVNLTVNNLTVNGELTENPFKQDYKIKLVGTKRANEVIDLTGYNSKEEFINDLKTGNLKTTTYQDILNKNLHTPFIFTKIKDNGRTFWTSEVQPNITFDNSHLGNTVNNEQTEEELIEADKKTIIAEIEKSKEELSKSEDKSEIRRIETKIKIAEKRLNKLSGIKKVTPKEESKKVREVREFTMSDKITIVNELLYNGLKNTDISQGITKANILLSILSTFDTKVQELKNKGYEAEANYMIKNKANILGLDSNTYDGSTREKLDALFELQEDEELIFDSEFIKDSNKESYENDMIKSLSSKVKIIFAGLEDTRNNQELFGDFKKYLPFSQSVNAIQQLLSDAKNNTIEDLIVLIDNKIENNPKEFGFYKEIKERLIQYNKTNPELIKQIMYMLYQQKTQMIFLLHESNKDGFKAQVLDANSKTPAIIKMTNWKNNLKNSPILIKYNEGFYKLNKDVVERATELYNSIMDNKEDVNLEELTEYLGYFGISLNETTLEKMKNNEFGNAKLTLFTKGSKVVDGEVIETDEKYGILVENQLVSLLQKNLEKAMKSTKELVFSNNFITDKDNQISLNLLTDNITSAFEPLMISDNKVSFLPMQSVYIGGKMINAYQQPKSIGNTLNKMKNSEEFKQELKDSPITSTSFTMEVMEAEPELKNHIDVVNISLEPLKKRGDKSESNNGITTMSTKDHTVTTINIFANDEGNVHIDKYSKDKEVELRKGIISFPTLSDSSQIPMLRTVLFDIQKSHFNSEINRMNDDILSILYEQMILPELRRISEFSKIGKTNIKGYDAGAKMITSMMSFEALMLPVNINGTTTIRPFTDVFVNYTNKDGKLFKDDIDSFFEQYKEEIYNEIHNNIDEQVNDYITEDGTEGLFVDNDIFTNGQLNYIDEKYKNSKKGVFSNLELARILAYDYVINYNIAQREIQTIFAGDVSNYFKDNMSKSFKESVPQIDLSEVAKYYYPELTDEQIQNLNDNLNQPGAIQFISENYPELLSSAEIAMSDVNKKFEDLQPLLLQKVNKIAENVQNNLSKRLKELISPGNIQYNSKDVNNRYFQIFLQDVESPAQNIETLVNVFYPGEWNETIEKQVNNLLRISRIYEDYRTPTQKKSYDKNKKELENKFPNIASYFNNATTDAQEYATWRDNLNLLKERGNLTNEQFEKIYKKLEAQEKDLDTTGTIKDENRWQEDEKELRKLSIMQPSKPLYSGLHHENINGFIASRYIYIKSSSFPLTPELTEKFPKLNNLRKNLGKLEKYDEQGNPVRTVRASYDSANKVGAVKNAVSINDLYSENADIESIASNSMVELKKENFYIQQDKPFESDKNAEAGKTNTINLATQFEKILLGDGISKIDRKIFPNMFDNKVIEQLNIKTENDKISGKDLKSIYNHLYKELQALVKEQLFHEFGISSFDEMNEGNQTAMENMIRILNSKLSNKQDKQALELMYIINLNGKETVLTQKEYNTHPDKKSLKVLRTSLKLPLFMMPNSRKLESVLNSMINKNSINLKLSGSSSPVASQEGFDFVGFNGDLETLKKQGLITHPDFDPQKGLQSTVIDGKLIEAQVFIANKYKLYNKETGKYEYIKLQDYINEDGQLDTNKLPEELLNMFSFRIPTSSHQSGVLIKVVGFLPHSSADLMIVPKEHTTQIGEDYDIDTRYFYNYNIIKDGDKLRKMTYDDIQKPDKELSELKKDFLKAKQDLWDRFYEERTNVNQNDPLNKKNFSSVLINDYLRQNEEKFMELAFLDEALSNNTTDRLIDNLLKSIFNEDYDAETVPREYLEERIRTLENELFSDNEVENRGIELRKEYRNLKSNLQELFRDEQSELRQSWDKYNNAINQKADERKVIDNNIISLYKSVYSSVDPEVQSLITKVLSTDNAENTAKLMDEKLKQSSNSKRFNFFSPHNQRAIMKLGADGKIGIGEHSNAVTQNSIFQQSDYEHRLINYYYEDEKGNTVAVPYNIVLGNMIFDGILGKIENNGVRISELGMESQNSSTDNQKLQIMGRRNENQFTMSVLKILQANGIDYDFMTNVNGKKIKMSYSSLFLNQPILRRYSELMAKYNSNTDNSFGDNEELVEKQLLEEFGKKLVWEVDKNNKPIVGKLSKTYISTHKVDKNLTSQKLWDELDLTDTLDNASQWYVYESFKQLKSAASKYNEIQKFTNIESGGMGVSYFDTINLMSQLVNIVTNPEPMITNQSKLFGDVLQYDINDDFNTEDLENEGYILINSKELQYENKILFIKPENHYAHKIVNSIVTGYNMFNTLFPYDHKHINEQISNIISISGLKDSSKQGLELKYKIISSLKDYIYSNNKTLFDNNLEQVTNELFFDNNNTNNASLASYLLSLSNSKEFKYLFSEPFFKDLQFEIYENTTPSLIKYNSSDLSKVNNLDIHNMFISLLNNKVDLPKYNGKEYNTELLMRDLLRYSVIADQGNGAIGFRHLLPIELFEKYLVTNTIKNSTDVNSPLIQNIIYNGPAKAIESLLNGVFENDTINNNFGININDIKNTVNIINSTIKSNYGIENTFTVKQDGSVVNNYYSGDKSMSTFVKQFIQHNPSSVKDKFDYVKNEFEPKGKLYNLLKENGYTLKDLNEGKVNNFYSNDTRDYVVLKDRNNKTLLYERKTNDGYYEQIPVLGTFGFNEYQVGKIVNTSKVKKNNFEKWKNTALEINKTKNLLNTDINTVIKSITDDKQSPFSAVLELFTGLIDLSNVKISIGESVGNAHYSLSTNSITVSQSYLDSNPTVKDLQRTLTEEILHSITMPMMKQYVSFKGINDKGKLEYDKKGDVPSEINILLDVYQKAIDEVIKEQGLEKTLEIINKINNLKSGNTKNSLILNSDEIITYRILDIDEFFAGIFLKDKPFVKKMANIKYKSSTKSILEKYADLITRLFYKILPNKRTNTISSEVTQQLYSLLKGDYADKLEKQKLDRLEQLKYEEAMNNELLQKQIDEGKNISVDDIFSPVQYNNYVSDSQLNNKDVSLSNEEFNSLNEQEKEYLMWSIKNC